MCLLLLDVKNLIISNYAEVWSFVERMIKIESGRNKACFSKADRAYIQNRSFLGELWHYLWKSQIALVEESC